MSIINEILKPRPAVFVFVFIGFILAVFAGASSAPCDGTGIIGFPFIITKYYGCYESFTYGFGFMGDRQQWSVVHPQEPLSTLFAALIIDALFWYAWFSTALYIAERKKLKKGFITYAIIMGVSMLANIFFTIAQLSIYFALYIKPNIR